MIRRAAAGASSVVVLALLCTLSPATAAPLAADPDAYRPFDVATMAAPKGVAVGGNVVAVADSGSGTATLVTACAPKSCMPGGSVTVPVGQQPSDVAVSESATSVAGRIYVTNSGDGTMTLIPIIGGVAVNASPPVTVQVGGEPTGLAVSPDGRWAYVSDTASNSLVVYDTVNLMVVTRVPVAAGPWGVAVSPDGARAFVAATAAGVVSVVDTAARAVVATIQVGTAPGDLAVDPTGRTLYVTNNGSGTVSVIDTATSRVSATVAVGTEPWGVAATATHAFVANHGSGTVSVISARTRRVVATVTTGTGPFGVGLDGTHAVFVTNTGSATVSMIALQAPVYSVAWSSTRRSKTVTGVVPFTAAVRYAIVARKGHVLRTGTCRLAPDGTRVVCRARLAKGTWHVSITTRLPWQPVAFGQQNKRFRF
jgi:YVTN family beta-propeller protein